MSLRNVNTSHINKNIVIKTNAMNIKKTHNKIGKINNGMIKMENMIEWGINIIRRTLKNVKVEK